MKYFGNPSVLLVLRRWLEIRIESSGYSLDLLTYLGKKNVGNKFYFPKRLEIFAYFIVWKCPNPFLVYTSMLPEQYRNNIVVKYHSLVGKMPYAEYNVC